MYQFLLSIHSQTRWLILLAAIFAIVMPYMNKEVNRKTKLPALVFMIICDIQLLSGSFLYFGSSPFGLKAFDNGMTFVLENPDFRKIAVEHFIIMMLAIILVHIGYSRVKNTTIISNTRRSSLVFFGIAFVLMLAGIPWTRIL